MGNEKREDQVWRAIKLLPFKLTVDPSSDPPCPPPHATGLLIPSPPSSPPTHSSPPADSKDNAWSTLLSFNAFFRY